MSADHTPDSTVGSVRNDGGTENIFLSIIAKKNRGQLVGPCHFDTLISDGVPEDRELTGEFRSIRMLFPRRFFRGNSLGFSCRGCRGFSDWCAFGLIFLIWLVHGGTSYKVR